MKPTSIQRMKLLVVGAFFAFTQFALGQSITVKHYENGNLTTPSFFTNNAPRLCAVDSVQLEATGFSGTLSWSGPNGAISSTATTIWVKEQGWYYLSDGTNNASVNIGKDNSNPEIYSQDYPITSSTNNGIGAYENAASPPGGLYGLLSPTKDYLAPFGAEYAYNKQQYLYTATELSSMGFDAGTTVKQIGFYLNNSWNGNCNTQVQIRVYESANSTLTNFVTGSSNYVGSWSCDLNYQSGWNYLDFSDFNWNGTDNLVFEFCYYSWGGSTPQNPLFALDNVGFAASVVAANVSDVCGSSSGFAIADYRPSTAFKYSNAARKDTVVLCGSSTTLRLTETAASYAWSSANSTYSGTTSTLAVSSSDVVYLTGLTSQFCKYDDTVQVYSAAETVPTITASSTDFCTGESTTLSTTLTADQTARWSNGGSGNQITVTDGGTYTVTVSNEFGCSKTSSGKAITEVVKPVIYKTSEGPSIAKNESHNVTGGQNYTSSFGPVHHLFDYNGEKYFTTQYDVDSTTYVNVLANNELAEMAVMSNSAINTVFKTAHQEKYQANSNNYPFTIKTGAIWNNTSQEPKYYDGTSSSYHDWDYGNTNPGSNNDLDHFVHYYYANYWSMENDWWNGAVLVKYDMSNINLATSGEIFCDSVQLFAPTNFDSYTWSTGETTSSIWVSGSGSHSVYVTGSYEKSDGSTCSLTSDTYTFTINDAPELTITNNSGTTDLIGTNTISLTASYTSGASLSWSTGATTDNISISSAGAYTATATLNGCAVSETVSAYEPIFVAKNGNNTTGDGTITNPYLTINYAISQASDGDKIYVRPGTYAETVDINKGVVIHSDAERLGNSAYRDSTIIDGGDNICVQVVNQYSDFETELAGFTFKDGSQTSGDNQGALKFQNSSNVSVLVKNSRITSSADNGQCCGNGGVIYASNIRKLTFRDMLIDNNGSSTQEARSIIALWGVSQGVDFINTRFINNHVTERLIHINNYTDVYVENSVFYGNSAQWDNQPIFFLDYSGTVVLNHVTVSNNDGHQAMYVASLNGNTEFYAFNSILDAFQVLNSSRDYNISNSFIRNNSLSGNGNNLGIDNVFGNSSAVSNVNYSLASSSAAIGIGTSSINLGGTIYESPAVDLYGISRPNPVGSNPDAGAIENSLSIGDFGADISSCGYGLNASVYNSTNY